MNHYYPVSKVDLPWKTSLDLSRECQTGCSRCRRAVRLPSWYSASMSLAINFWTLHTRIFHASGLFKYGGGFAGKKKKIEKVARSECLIFRRNSEVITNLPTCVHQENKNWKLWKLEKIEKMKMFKMDLWLVLWANFNTDSSRPRRPGEAGIVLVPNQLLLLTVL